MYIFYEKILGGVDYGTGKEEERRHTEEAAVSAVFGAIAQLEREYILDRQREGIEIARQNGKYKGRKPVAVDGEKFKEVYRRWRSGEIQGRG